jgi:hypothetical protein
MVFAEDTYTTYISPERNNHIIMHIIAQYCDPVLVPTSFHTGAGCIYQIKNVDQIDTTSDCYTKIVAEYPDGKLPAPYQMSDKCLNIVNGSRQGVVGVDITCPGYTGSRCSKQRSVCGLKEDDLYCFEDKIEFKNYEADYSGFCVVGKTNSLRPTKIETNLIKLTLAVDYTTSNILEEIVDLLDEVTGPCKVLDDDGDDRSFYKLTPDGADRKGLSLYYVMTSKDECKGDKFTEFISQLNAGLNKIDNLPAETITKATNEGVKDVTGCFNIASPTSDLLSCDKHTDVSCPIKCADGAFCTADGQCGSERCKFVPYEVQSVEHVEAKLCVSSSFSFIVAPILAIIALAVSL